MSEKTDVDLDVDTDLGGDGNHTTALAGQLLASLDLLDVHNLTPSGDHPGKKSLGASGDGDTSIEVTATATVSAGKNSKKVPYMLYLLAGASH